MKITIETTPQELAELIFTLVDCDFEVDDDEEEEFDEDAEMASHEKDTRDQFIVQMLYKILEQTNKKAP